MRICAHNPGEHGHGAACMCTSECPWLMQNYRSRNLEAVIHEPLTASSAMVYHSSAPLMELLAALPQLLIGLLQSMVAVAAGLLVMQLLMKVYRSSSAWFFKRQFAMLNVACSSASGCLALAVVCKYCSNRWLSLHPLELVDQTSGLVSHPVCERQASVW